VIPYADSLYFSVLIYPTLLTIVLGLFGRLSWRWVLGINLAMLAVQYSGLGEVSSRETIRKIWVVAGYGFFQWGVASLFLQLRSKRSDKAIFRAVLITALLPLVVVKFLPLDFGNSYVGFLGISYVTFRSLDVIFCIQDRLISSLSPGRYLVYLLFFPTISSGPLDRYNRFLKDTAHRRTRIEFLQDLDGAVHRFFRGLLYAFILAALVKRYWLDPVSMKTGLLSVISYMYAYSFYLFFDFAGYSAFAIAFGYLLGIHTPENFNRPFFATNIVDFWNRWHMSLSTWFRDHVYMRFLMAAMRGRWFSSKLVMSCVGFYVSFGLMGIWHGTAARYIVYGFYHATLLAGYTILTDYRKGHPPLEWRLRKLAGTVVTFHLVCFGLLIFSGRLG
jgi:membrane protein involved in D-alanine export